MTWQLDERRIPSKEEVARLLKAAKERSEAALSTGRRQPVIDYAVLSVFCFSGVRSHELCALKIADIQFRDSLLVVQRGKGGKRRVVVIPERLKKALKAFLEWKSKRGESTEPDAPLFCSERGEAFCTRGIRYLFKRSLFHAGIELRYGVHSLRHHYCSSLYACSKDLRLTQSQLGHSSPVITANVYTHVDADSARSAVNRL